MRVYFTNEGDWRTPVFVGFADVQMRVVYSGGYDARLPAGLQTGVSRATYEHMGNDFVTYQPGEDFRLGDGESDAV